MSEKKTINADDLKKKFKEQWEVKLKADVYAMESQQQLNGAQQFVTKVIGAAEGTINLLADLIGKEEAEKIAQEVMNPKTKKKKDDKE